VAVSFLPVPSEETPHLLSSLQLTSLMRKKLAMIELAMATPDRPPLAMCSLGLSPDPTLVAGTGCMVERPLLGHQMGLGPLDRLRLQRSCRSRGSRPCADCPRRSCLEHSILVQVLASQRFGFLRYSHLIPYASMEKEHLPYSHPRHHQYFDHLHINHCKQQ
jgi:hypothetical protein